LRVEADQKHVTAWVTTQNEDAKNLLLQNTASLQKHLADQGLDLGQFNVNVGGDKGSQQPFAGRREQRRRSKTDGKAGAEIVTGITPRMQATGSNQMISLIA
jgi:flagellar hook-length control protein FliK